MLCGLGSAEGDDCRACGGALTFEVVEGAAVDLDFVLLMPGPWGRYKGLPLHAAAANFVDESGASLLRYGGTCVAHVF